MRWSTERETGSTRESRLSETVETADRRDQERCGRARRRGCGLITGVTKRTRFSDDETSI
eukprot:4669627-Prymnesium_polylepis.2